MKPLLVLAAACVLTAALQPAPARADLVEYSHLGIAVQPAGVPPGDLLAQRTIDREWGPADDSTYREVDVPGYKSEGFAMLLSGVLPGAGHLYLGENSGWAFALSEAVLWAGHWYEARNARQEWDRIGTFLGNPYDSTATFSFARYTARTHNNADALERLYNGDRSAYYRELNGNPGYIEGFPSINLFEVQSSLHNMVDAHDVSLRRELLFDTVIWANHLLAALDALRAARAHNAPLREEYHIELGQRWHDGQRELRAALVRRF